MSGPSPDPDPHPVSDPDSARSTWRHRLSVLVGGIGCLSLLALLPLVAIMLLAIFLDEPVLYLALIALLIAVAAYKAAKRR